MDPVLILAGGLGTRLRPVVGDVPKPLAPVAGRPFLWWLLTHLSQQGADLVYLSVGYRHEAIAEALGTRFGTMDLRYVVEEEPLGTGGAVLLCAEQMPGDRFLLLNGDTLAAMDLQRFARDARERGSDTAIALAHVQDAARYGTVDFDPQQARVQRFLEKGRGGPGWINAGVYSVRKQSLTGLHLTRKFSFEQDFLARHAGELHLQAWPQVREFIDIGVPDDYSRSQEKVPQLLRGPG